MWPLFLGTRPFNWTWSPWTKSKWTFMNIALWWNIQYLRLVWLHKFIVQISLPFPADQQQKQTEIAICSQNSVWNLEFAIDFWCLQLTFDVFNWVYSKHMIHYNKVNWKIFAKNFLKIFPIDLQSPIDFSQLHMIRPLELIGIFCLQLAQKTRQEENSNCCFLIFDELFLCLSRKPPKLITLSHKLIL